MRDRPMKKKASTASQHTKSQTGQPGVSLTNDFEIASMNGELRDLMSTLRTVRNNAMPKQLHKQFEKAHNLRETNDLIGAIISLYIEFGNQGFQFYIKNERAKKRFNPIIEKFNLLGLNVQLWDSLCTQDNVVLHWKMRNATTVEYINVLNPYDLEVVPGLNNQALVYLKVPDVIKRLVNARSLTPEEKRLLDSIPQKYKDAAKGSIKTSVLIQRPNMVLLSNDDNEYWVIANTGGFSDRLIPPKMRQVFDSIENRNMLIDGDFSIAFLIKSFIMQVRTGESINTGPKAGSRQNWATKKHLKALQQHFKTTGKAMWFFTDHTTEILHHFPDVKLFDPQKFASPENRILAWAGIGKILMLGEGANFAAGFINLKRLIAKVKRYREVISSVWETFFLHSSIKGDIAKIHIPKLIYDDSLLKESNMDLKEKQFLVDRGGLSLQTALIKAGYDPDIEEQNKQEELGKLDVYQPKLTSMMPIEEAVSKQKEKQERGRPANEVPSHGETTLNAPQNPRPSTASESHFSMPNDLLTQLLENADDPVKELATISKLPKEALGIWIATYRTEISSENHQASGRKAWSSVRSQFKRSKGTWVKKDSKR